MFFFFNDTATTEIYTLSLHDALPIYLLLCQLSLRKGAGGEKSTSEWLFVFGILGHSRGNVKLFAFLDRRSEEHTSELQSRQYLVCRLLLEKKITFFLLLVIALPTPVV